MAGMNKMRNRNYTPILALLHERHKFNELNFSVNDDVACQDVDASINLICYGFCPNLTMEEKSNGAWLIHSGSVFIKALIEFMDDKHVYSETGLIEAYRGKRFSELCRTEQRILRESKLSALLCDGESDLFVELSGIARRLA